MRLSINNKPKNKILPLLTIICFYFITNVEQALAGGDEVTQTSTEQTSSASPSTPNAGSLTVTPTTVLQTGTNNYANLNSTTGSLNYPACNGTCGFAIMRTSPINNNGSVSNQVEGVIGVIHAFSSPDQTNAETNRQMIEIQKQRSEHEIAMNYQKAIADACQSKDLIRAELSAKGLARIWNVDYKTLLRPSCS